VKIWYGLGFFLLELSPDLRSTTGVHCRKGVDGGGARFVAKQSR
jgi:hypothetical protein